MNIILRALLIGSSNVILFYVCFIVIGFWGTLVLGFINGFLSAGLVFAKHRSKHKIAAPIATAALGLAMIVAMYDASLYLRLPDWLVDYFIYGYGGGGMEPGNWFAFKILRNYFFGSGLFFGFPFGIIFFGIMPLYERKNKND